MFIGKWGVVTTKAYRGKVLKKFEVYLLFRSVKEILLYSYLKNQPNIILKNKAPTYDCSVLWGVIPHYPLYRNYIRKFDSYFQS